MKIETYKVLTREFENEWNLLWQESENATVFNSLSWFLVCLETYKYSDYLIITVYKDNKLTAVLPLIRSKKYGLPVFCCPGGSFLDKTSMLLINEDENLIKFLVKSITDLGNIYLAEVEDDLAELIKKMYPCTLKYFMPMSSSPYILLAGDPFEHVLERHKNEMNRMKSPHIRIELKSSPALSDLRMIFELENISTKKDKEIQLFDDIKTKEFFNNYLSNNPESIGISFLYYDNKPVAGDLGFIFKKTFRGFYTVYDKKYKNLGPGKLLHYLMVNELKNKGFMIFDLSRGHSSFKKELAFNEVNQSDLYFSKNYLYILWWKFINFIRIQLESRPNLYEYIIKFKRSTVGLLSNSLILSRN